MVGVSRAGRTGGDADRTVPRVTARRMMREAVRRRLVPGDRLASEPTLMSYFDVSRGSLRESLRVLSYLGAVEVRSGPGGGARIALPGVRVVGSALAITLQFRGTTLRGLLEARAALEPTAARLAAERQADVADLRASLVRLVAAGAPAERRRERLEFHRLLAAATGNDVLSLMLTAAAWLGDALDPEPPPDEAADRLRAGLVTAIDAGDAAAAAEHASALHRAILADLRDRRLLGERVLWSDVDELPDLDDRKDGTTWT